MNTKCSIKQCQCCKDCKNRITRLEEMINQIYCQLTDYLPDQICKKDYDTIDETFSLINTVDIREPVIEEEVRFTPRVRKPRNSSNKYNDNKSQNVDSDKISIKPPRIIDPDRKRKEYSLDQKKQHVDQVKEMVKKGQKIVDACKKLGISDRSFQRWKNFFEKGDEDDDDFDPDSGSDIIIANANV